MRKARTVLIAQQPGSRENWRVPSWTLATLLTFGFHSFCQISMQDVPRDCKRNLAVIWSLSGKLYTKVEKEQAFSFIRKSWIQILSIPLPSCMIMGKSFKLWNLSFPIYSKELRIVSVPPCCCKDGMKPQPWHVARVWQLSVPSFLLLVSLQF